MTKSSRHCLPYLLHSEGGPCLVPFHSPKIWFLLKKKYRGLKMKYRTLKLLRRRKNARRRSRTTEKGVQALIIGLALVLFLLVGCENIKHKIGISTKPFQSGEDLEDNTKINYTIVFGKVRPQEDD